jgi:hypothetical protein
MKNLAVKYYPVVGYTAVCPYFKIRPHAWTFLKIAAVLQPPKPEAVFKKWTKFLKVVSVITLMGCDTPNSSNPREVYKVLWYRECMPTMVSNNPEAPKVCPKYPFKLLTGTFPNPDLFRAMDSISSLYKVAVPWAEI